MCHHAVSRDEDLLVIYRDIDGETNSLDGPIQLTNLSVDYAEELVFSKDLFFASTPYYGDDTTGAVFVTSNSTNTTLIIPEHGDVDSFGGFGNSIAVDGDTLIVGAPNDDNSVGSAFVYRRQQTDIGSTWLKEAKLQPDDSGIQSFGRSVLIRDGTIAVSASHHGTDSSGAVYFYQLDTLTQADILINDDCDGKFGSSLALTANGGLLIGCPLDDDVLLPTIQ